LQYIEIKAKTHSKDSIVFKMDKIRVQQHLNVFHRRSPINKDNVCMIYNMKGSGSVYTCVLVK